MNEKDLARAVAADLGANVIAEVEAELAAIPSREARRAYSLDETTAMAGFIVAATRYALSTQAAATGRDEAMAALARMCDQRATVCDDYRRRVRQHDLLDLAIRLLVPRPVPPFPWVAA